jgi:hypothetical protein
MVMMMKIILYQNKYRGQLEDLLRRFSSEVFNSDLYDVDKFVDNHWCIYLSVDGETVTGFSSFIKHDYYGLMPEVLGNTYIYVVPECRTSKAMYLFSIQAGKISVDNKLPLEHYYSSESSKRLSRKLKGKKIYETYIYEFQEVERIFSKLTSKVRIKK